jgi:hypothetical protein
MENEFIQPLTPVLGPKNETPFELDASFSLNDDSLELNASDDDSSYLPSSLSDFLQPI